MPQERMLVAVEYKQHLMLRLLAQESGQSMTYLISRLIDMSYGALCDEYAGKADVRANATNRASELIEKHPSVIKPDDIAVFGPENLPEDSSNK